MEDRLNDIENSLEGTKSRKAKYIMLGVGIILVVFIIIVILILLKKNPKKNILDNEISTINFTYNNTVVNYFSSYYDYEGRIIIIYQKEDPNNYFVGIAKEDGKIFKEIIEMKNDIDIIAKNIRRPSSFSDGKRVFIGGKILECTNLLFECNDAKLIDIIFPEEIEKFPDVMLVFTDCFINYGSNHLFWSTFDKNMNTFNFVGELSKKDDGKYHLDNVQGISNFFYNTYNENENNYILPRMIKYGPIKQVIKGGEGIVIGGFLNYGLRKGIYQSLSEDKLTQLTTFEGYDENTILSPDLKLAIVETTMFSSCTSLEIMGFIPTPYSILASYFFSIDALNIIMFKVNTENYKGNLGPALIEIEKAKKDKYYKGENLKVDKGMEF